MTLPLGPGQRCRASSTVLNPGCSCRVTLRHVHYRADAPAPLPVFDVLLCPNHGYDRVSYNNNSVLLMRAAAESCRNAGYDVAVP